MIGIHSRKHVPGQWGFHFMGMQFVLHSMLRLVLLQVQGCFGTLQKLENNGCLYCVLIFEENFFSSSQFQKARNHANCIQKQFSFKRSWSETYLKGILAQFPPTQTDEKLHFLSLVFRQCAPCSSIRIHKTVLAWCLLAASPNPSEKSRLAMLNAGLNNGRSIGIRGRPWFAMVCVLLRKASAPRAK